MSNLEPLYKSIVNTSHKLSRKETQLVEAELFLRLCNELKEIFKAQYKEYFRLMKFNAEMEDTMLEDNFARCVINDILATEEYTLTGIAYYTQTPEDVVYEVAMGHNINPSAKFFRKIIELHRFVRRELYSTIFKKIYAETENTELK